MHHAMARACFIGAGAVALLFIVSLVSQNTQQSRNTHLPLQATAIQTLVNKSEQYHALSRNADNAQHALVNANYAKAFADAVLLLTTENVASGLAGKSMKAWATTTEKTQNALLKRVSVVPTVDVE